jgi:DNA-binding NtrC family response regulator
LAGRPRRRPKFAAVAVSTTGAPSNVSCNKGRLLAVAPLLSWTFVKKFSNSNGQTDRYYRRRLDGRLLAYPWPGNVRELRNVIERAMILTRGPTLQIKLGQPTLRPQNTNAQGTLEEAEREHILQALQRCGWRIRGSNAAAELLGVKPTTLESRIKKLGLVQKQ